MFENKINIVYLPLKIKIFLLVVIAIFFSFVAIILSTISLRVSLKCDGYPLLDQIVQNTAEGTLLMINNVTKGIESINNKKNNNNNISSNKSSNFEMWFNLQTNADWKQIILKEMVKNIKRDISNEDVLKWRLMSIFKSKVYDCQNMNLIFSSRNGVQSIKYENLNRASNRNTLNKVFMNLCEDLNEKTFQHSHETLQIFLDNNMLNIKSQIDDNYNLIIRLNTHRAKFLSATISDFPSSTLNKKRIYSLPCNIMILKKNITKQRYDRIDINVIIFSYYALESVC